MHHHQVISLMQGIFCIYVVSIDKQIRYAEFLGLILHNNLLLILRSNCPNSFRDFKGTPLVVTTMLLIAHLHLLF